jgi:hypothetical protein
MEKDFYKLDWLCKLGIHKWGEWSMAEPHSFIDNGKTFWFQDRNCSRCGQYNFRILPFYRK